MNIQAQEERQIVPYAGQAWAALVSSACVLLSREPCNQNPRLRFSFFGVWMCLLLAGFNPPMADPRVISIGVSLSAMFYFLNDAY
jgi:hypothetical protein